MSVPGLYVMPANCPHCGHPLQLLAAQDAAKKNKTSMTLKQWIASLPPGEEVFSSESRVFKYAEEVKLPEEYVRIAWIYFYRYYRDKLKKYTDWPRHFLNSVRGNWAKYWAINRNGEYYLTTAGEQAMRELHARSAR